MRGKEKFLQTGRWRARGAELQDARGGAAHTGQGAAPPGRVGGRRWWLWKQTCVCVNSSHARVQLCVNIHFMYTHEAYEEQHTAPHTLSSHWILSFYPRHPLLSSFLFFPYPFQSLGLASRPAGSHWAATPRYLTAAREKATGPLRAAQTCSSVFYQRHHRVP